MRLMIHAATRVTGLALYAAALATLHAPAPAAAQDLLSAADVVAMESPEPDARIPYGDAELQFGNLRLPEGPGPHPVIVFIHGGCWLSQFGIGHVGQTTQAFAAAGYAVWSLEYRRVGDEGGGWPGTFLDVARGIDHLRELARAHPLDLSRVIASGHSAGGQLALWAAARPGIPSASELYAARPLPIQGVLALAPAADLESLHGAGVCGEVVDKLMGGSPEARPARYDAVSPMRMMPVDVPQRLVIGAHDRSWAPGGRAYFERVRADGSSPASLREAPESGHFEMIVPTTSSWPVVLEELEELTREMARRREGR